MVWYADPMTPRYDHTVKILLPVAEGEWQWITIDQLPADDARSFYRYLAGRNMSVELLGPPSPQVLASNERAD